MLKFNRRWRKISKDTMKRIVTNPLAPHNAWKGTRWFMCNCKHGHHNCNCGGGK